ncbi:hypothetical protein BU17DRAFT_79575 [Hysterangium stoloniferum]|nr:hypothetical protein BU17DRAFT_79575 [Hysterangium stoloniferum]
MNILYPPGAFLLCTLNSQATLSPLKDSTATEVAEKIHHKTYLALLMGTTHGHHHDGIELKLQLRIVSRNPPTAKPFPDLNELSFVAIHPAVHPLGRKAVHPSSPLPWDNCMFYCDDIRTFSPAAQNREVITGISVSDGDYCYLEDVIDQDRSDREKQWRPTFIRQPFSGVTFPSSEIQDSSVSSSADPSKDHEEITSCRFNKPEGKHPHNSKEEAILLRRLEYIDEKHDYMMDISFDLTSCCEIGDLADLLGECKSLSEIVQKSKERTQTRLQELSNSKEDTSIEKEIGLMDG